ncbi:MAG: hypothetical protein NUV67_00535, partial [archaeon]|nr:hypothetical protein [archaeon]
MRAESFKETFESNSAQVTVFSPERSVGEKISGYKRYAGTIAAFNFARSKKFDLVIGTSPPMTHSFFALLGAKIGGAKFVLDIRDPWTDAAIGLGNYSAFNPKIWAYKAIEFFSYNLADRIFVVTKELGEIVAKKTFNRKKITLIENGSFWERFRFREDDRILARKLLKIPLGAKTAIYSGSFAKKGVVEMLKALSPHIRAKGFYVILLVPFDGSSEFSEIKKTISECNLSDSVRMVDLSLFRSDFEVARFFAAADLGLNPLPDAMAKYCIPAKTYDYLSSGLLVAGFGNVKGALARFT